MVVDDDEGYLALMEEGLSGRMLRVVTCSEPRRTLALLDEEKPDLLLLDVSMPEMDGLQVCTCVRDAGRFTRLKIAFVSAKTSEEDVARGLRAGADEYIKKPFDIEDLRARVHHMLHLPGE